MILFLIALNCAALALYVFILRRVETVRSRTIEASAAHGTIARQQERIAMAQHLATDIEPTAQKLTTVALESEGVIDFIESIEAVATNISVTVEIQSVDISSLTGNEEYEFVSTNFTVSGDFGRVLDTVKAIEYMPLALSITRVRLERTSGDDEDEWRASLVLKALKKK